MRERSRQLSPETIAWRGLLWHRGEEAAAQFLLDGGYTILERNWRVGRYAEIDIIASDPKGLLVFVEVKSRLCELEPGFPVQGFEAIRQKKRHKIVTSAMFYVVEKHLETVSSRIDIIVVSYSRKANEDGEICLSDGDSYENVDLERPTITHIRQAFP